MTEVQATNRRHARQDAIGGGVIAGSRAPARNAGVLDLSRPPYTGEAPLESCHLQGIANILESQNLYDAKRKLGLSWGFEWDGAGGQLQNGRRWISLANAAYGLDIERHAFESWSAASALERKLTYDGTPFVAAVDAFYVPSPHFQRRHFPHTLIVTAARQDQVVLVDPMNLPEPTRYSRHTYELMRTHDCVWGYHLYRSARGPGPTGIEEEHANILNALAENLVVWPHSLKALDAYLAAMASSDESIDVAHPAAERLYLTGLLGLLAERDELFHGCASACASLTKRWYFVHTLSMQSSATGRSQRPRLLRLLAELRERELAMAEKLGAAVLPRADLVGSVQKGSR